MNKLESIIATVKIAEEWAKKGEFDHVDECLSSAILGFLSLAVCDSDDSDMALEFLISHDMPSLLSKELDVLHFLIRKVDAGEIIVSSIGGNYHYLAEAHLAIWLGLYDLAEQYLVIANRVDVQSLSTPFWCEYAKGFFSLVNGHTYVKSDLKFVGVEKHWGLYLDLMERGSPTTELVGGIERSFARRNRVGSGNDDAYAIDGNKEDPVKLDFRLSSLIAFFEKRL